MSLRDADCDAPLLALARRSIEHGLAEGRPLAVVLETLPIAARAPGASFVTLRRERALRGCIGSLEPRRPLAEDVAANAWSAAFADPRFAPLARAELEGLAVSVSLLEPSRPLPVRSEAELLATVEPGVDGLVLRVGERRATFLPAVWKSLPEPRAFVAELKRKAGLPADYWSDALAFERYRVREIA